MHPSLPTGTVSFLFTDIEGSTGLAQQHPVELPALLAQHHAVLRRSIEAHRGYVFQIVGDAFCAAFFTAADALLAALAAQRELQQADWHPAAIRVRMGIHTGPAQAESREGDAGVYTGYLTLARVQRVMATAYGRQILVSSAAAELLRGELPEGVQLRDLGEHRLKGLLNPERLWQVTAPDLPSEFPPLPSLNAIPNNLPVQLNSFIGRELELTQARELLTSTHLLTFIGPGGTGKTRLALQLAAEILPEFDEGVWLVELAPLADPALVLQTIAETLGLREIPGASLRDLVTRYLCAKHLVLILDNCEHLVETCARLADHFLRSCPNLKIIASSREALGIAGETVYTVPPLALPDAEDFSIESVRRSEAVQLFLDRAAAVKPGFGLSEHNAPAVAQISRRLDGIPLALELAAARIAMLTPEQIAARLDDRFRLLTGGSRTVLPRQQTLRSLIDWSYDLLSEPERLLFCQLAVFAGGWSLEAAEAVCPELDVLELLTQLVQKSLVVAETREGVAAARFRLLETVHQYARERLLEMEAAPQVRDRHLAYYLNFAESVQDKFFSPQRLEWFDQCELEHDNFRAALQWGLERDAEAALRLGGSLSVFWSGRGFNVEGRRWLQAALDRAAALPEPQGEAGRQRQAARAQGLLGASQISYGDGDYQAGLDASKEAVRLYTQLGDRSGLGYALCYMGHMAAFQGDIATAEQALTDAARVGRELGDILILIFALGVRSQYVYLPRGDITAAHADAIESARLAREAGVSWVEAQSEMLLSRIAAGMGQWEEARKRMMNAAEVFLELRDPLALNQAYRELGDIELRAGNLAEARRYHQECILGWQKLGTRSSVAHELESFAFIAQAENQPARVARLLGAAETLREEIGTPVFGAERLEIERAVAWLKAQFDDTTYHLHWEEGRAMSVDQAISFALEA